MADSLRACLLEGMMTQIVWRPIARVGTTVWMADSLTGCLLEGNFTALMTQVVWRPFIRVGAETIYLAFLFILTCRDFIKVVGMFLGWPASSIKGIGMSLGKEPSHTDMGCLSHRA